MKLLGAYNCIIIYIQTLGEFARHELIIHNSLTGNYLQDTNHFRGIRLSPQTTASFPVQTSESIQKFTGK